MTLQDKLAKAAILKAKIDKLAPLKVELDELKFDILTEMSQTHSKRTEAYSGVYAVRATRTNVSVTSPQEVESWLTANDFMLDDYVRLDEQRVKALADERLHETGEIIPGLTVEETEHITLKKEVKK
jgi:hypothetical protein